MTSSKEEISLSSSDECGCILEQLILRKFDLFNYDEKLEIINNGKPTPPLPNLYYQTKKFTRHFHESHYSATPWLCGCKKTNRLYCWPCVLFADDNNVWSKKGVNDLNDISNLSKIHSLSKTHINSAICLVKFRNVNIDMILKKTSREESRKSNETIKNNRHVIDRFIDATCYLVEQDLNFEEKTSFEIKNFNELVNMLSNTDPILKHHLNHSTVFTLACNNIQNDLIESIAESLNNEIRREVMETPFLSIILGGYVDVSNKTICSVIFRYVTSENGICERFIKFLEINKDRTEISIANNLLTLVNQFQCTNKVVAHSFDGAVISVEKRGSLQRLINSTCKEAIYVPYHAHHLNFIIIQSLSNIKEVKQFFETLISVHNFFTKSPKRSTMLELMTKRTFPTAPTSTNIINTIVDLIMHLKEELIEVFKRMDNSEEWDLDTCSLARDPIPIFVDSNIEV
ncbi:hypothetical protein O3M35_009112 [Rhynocoris fuscipes]|uniref:DUF4371 domain-containing protein n=1 Tax=Rhynocoris fuscipes TaxID=488301 RepID=A0AAW1D2K5_9HEMI